MARRISISGFVLLVRAARSPVAGLANLFRLVSFTFLGWLALEAYKFANTYSTSHADAYDGNGANRDVGNSELPSRSEHAQDVEDSDLPKSGTHYERHAKVENTTAATPRESADFNDNNPIKAVGSSTDPNIISRLLPPNPTPDVTIAGTLTTAPKFGVKDGNADTLGPVNQTAVLPTGPIHTIAAQQIDTTAPAAPTLTSITLGGGGGNHWVLAGAAEANSNIAIFDGGTQIATVTTSGFGAWSYTTTGSVTDSSPHIFTTNASDAAGNTSGPSTAWIEGTPGNDTFTFSSAAQLTAPIVNGNGGADTIAMTAPVTLNSGDFTNVSGVQTLQLTGASAVTLGADAVTAGILSIVTGNGTTSIADSNGVALGVDATALADNMLLSLSGAAGFTVTGLQGDLSATGVSGALNVTTVAVASGLSIATGSGSNTITATALTTGQTLSLTGSSAATVTLNAGASSGNLAAGTYTGNLTVTGGSGANTITVGNGTNTITGGGGADILTGGTGNDTFNFSSAANLGATATIAGGAGNDTIAVTAAATLTDANFLPATSIETLALTGASTITLGANAASAGIVNVITGAGATSITDSNGVTLNVDTTALANNTTLTLIGSSAEVVGGLIGNITASALTGALTVTTGDATDNTIAITTGSAATSITDNFNTDTVTVTAAALAQNTALTLAGSAAEVVSGLVGDINAGALTGALTVTTGNAADNGISITTGSAATSITASGAGDTVTVNATALTANTLTLAGSAAAVVTLGTGGSLAAGTDTGNLTVTGGSGINTIVVGSGNNTITGGGGADVLTGGAGSDHFVFNATSDSTVAAHDSINNFVHGSDVIDTSTILGITAVQGLISGATQIAPHSIAWIQNGADTIVYANSTGAAEAQAAADMEIVLKSITASILAGSDFIHQ